MEFNIIEFNGIPGSGKSTICNELYIFLKNKNYIVYTEKDVFLNENNFKKITQLLSIKNIKLNIYILKLGFKCSLKVRKIKPLTNSIKQIRYFNVLTNYIKEKDNSILLLSEGVIQFLSTIYDEGNFLYPNLVKKILSNIKITKYTNYIFFNCQIDVEEAFKRITNRKSEPNTIDMMDKNILKKFLVNRKNNLKEIQRINDLCNRTYNLNTKNDIIDNVKEVNHHI